MKKRGKVFLTLLMILCMSIFAAGGTMLFASAEEGQNLTTDAANWSAEKSIGYSGASFSADGIKMTEAPSALVLASKVAKNSKIELVFEGKAENASWGNFCVMFKAGDSVAAQAGLNGTGDGNYLALKFGSDGTWILESTDGVLKKTDKSNALTDPEALSGYDSWYPHKQVTEITIQTIDTSSGVNVEITYLASGLAENTGKTYTLTYSSVNTALAGDYNVAVSANWDKVTAPDSYIGVKSFVVSLSECGETAGSVDALITALPETVTEENYATAKPQILAARNAYEGLSESEKQNVTKLDKLLVAEAAVKDYEATVAAKPVNDQIAELPQEVNSLNYASVKLNYIAICNSVEKLNDEVQEKVNIADLNAVGDALTAYETSEEGKSANLATDVAYWKSGVNPVCFSFDERGMGLWDTQSGAMVSNQVVPANSSIYLDVKGTQVNGAYGNLYVVFKNDAKRNIFNGGVTPLAEGNYLVFMIGADGCKIYDCKDGVVKTEVFDAADNLDAWYFYKQTLNLMITTTDTETGVNVTIEFVGPSGKLTHKDYVCENPALKGESYMGVELFLSAGGTGTEWVNIRELKVIGMETGYIPELDVEELNTLAEQTAAMAITSTNIEQVRENLQTLKEAQADMNYPQSVEFDAQKIVTIEANIAAYEANILLAQAVDTQIEALSEEVNAENYEQVSAAIQAARSAYDALTAEAKALVENVSKLEAAESALKAYEDSLGADEEAEAVDDKINALPAEITAENYESAKKAIQEARAAYDALDSESKEAVTQLSKLTSAEQALQTYEESLDGNGDTQNKQETGCSGSLNVYAWGISLLILSAAAVVVFKKKKHI